MSSPLFNAEVVSWILCLARSLWLHSHKGVQKVHKETRFKLVFHNKTSAGFFNLSHPTSPPPPTLLHLSAPHSAFTWARWLHVFPLLPINVASWQIVHCDTSVGGKGNWYDDDLTCPAGDTGGRYHGDLSCCPTSFWMCFAIGNGDVFWCHVKWCHSDKFLIFWKQKSLELIW